MIHPAQHFAWCTLHIKLAYQISRVTIYSLDYSFPDLESVYCFMSGSNCCFLTCIQVSQEADKVVWYSHLFKNFPQFVVIHIVKGFSVVKEGEVMSLLFNMLSRLVIAFLPRSKHLLISWLQSPSTVILDPKKIKSVTVSIVPHLFAVKWWDRMPWC